MALIEVSFMSKSLMRKVPFQIILPVDKVPLPGEKPRADKPFKTLYLLHGLFGSTGDWLSGTRIQRWAEQNNLAVVMPSGDNGFYVDHIKACNYYSCYIGEELVEITRKMFPLSDKRADTFIGGLSMGGYGALYNGLKYHETFSHILAFSPAILFEADFGKGEPLNATVPGSSLAYYEHIMGMSQAEAKQTEFNQRVQILELKEKVAKKAAKWPGIYLAIGTEDTLCYPTVKTFEHFLLEEKIPHTYIEDKGGHEWDFWDRHIHQALRYLPLEKTEVVGISSDHVDGKSN